MSMRQKDGDKERFAWGNSLACGKEVLKNAPESMRFVSFTKRRQVSRRREERA